ncbi:MAG: DUF3991 and TOPRIM domain-containing protein [Clostridia bacterium]
MNTRKYVTREEIMEAKRLDLLTYLQTYEPHELVKCGSSYQTRTHDSLKISNGLWNWYSRGIGGKTALDYLIHVKGMDFVSAVQALYGNRIISPAASLPDKKKDVPFVLPERYPDPTRVTAYLMKRGISYDVIARCLENGTLYEADRYRNAVFVGKDMQGTPRYAMQRSTSDHPLKLEVEGSDKRFSFSLRGTGDALFVAESAIDALSVASILQQSGQRWQSCHYLSLGGVSAKQASNELPRALGQYLTDHLAIQHVRLMLDNDQAGRTAAQRILAGLGGSYDAKAVFPKRKDFNEELTACLRKSQVIER